MTATASRERRVLPSGVRPENLVTGDSLPIIESGGPYIYLLESGIALVERDNRFGDWDNLGYRRPNSTFGEILKGAKELDHQKRVTALQDSSLLRIERAKLEEIMQSAPGLAVQLRNAVMEDSYAAEDRLALIAGTTLAERLPVVLLDLAGDGTARFLLNQELIGKAAGGERATVNQMLMKYKRRGILLYGKGIAINGEDGVKALQALAEGTVPSVLSSHSRPSVNGTTLSMIPN